MKQAKRKNEMAIVAEEYEMLQPTIDLNKIEEFEDTDATLND